jgi:hypothetical protein
MSSVMKNKCLIYLLIVIYAKVNQRYNCRKQAERKEKLSLNVAIIIVAKLAE